MVFMVVFEGVWWCLDVLGGQPWWFYASKMHHLDGSGRLLRCLYIIFLILVIRIIVFVTIYTIILLLSHHYYCTIY